MSRNASFWEGRTFCLVTGASRGIGQAIAVQFAKMMTQGSALLLLARGVKGLDLTKSQVSAAAPKVKVVTESVDLSNCDASKYMVAIKACLDSLGQKASDFDHAIIVHNAASVGNSAKVTSLEQRSDIEGHMALNIMSPICLNSQFLKVFHEGRRTVVQVTSDAALNAYPLVGLYCASKSYRNMLFKVFAMEEPSIQVLNYAPGVVATDMLKKSVESSAKDPEKAKKILESKFVITPSESALKLIAILQKGDYKSGDHVDYYDDRSAYDSFGVAFAEFM